MQLAPISVLRGEEAEPFINVWRTQNLRYQHKVDEEKALPSPRCQTWKVSNFHCPAIIHWECGGPAREACHILTQPRRTSRSQRFERKLQLPCVAKVANPLARVSCIRTFLHVRETPAQAS